MSHDPATGEDLASYDAEVLAAAAAARQRAAGLADDERKKRRRLAAELVEELRRPLIDKHGPTDLEALAAMSPHPRPVR